MRILTIVWSQIRNATHISGAISLGYLFLKPVFAHSLNIVELDAKRY